MIGLSRHRRHTSHDVHAESFSFPDVQVKHIVQPLTRAIVRCPLAAGQPSVGRPTASPGDTPHQEGGQKRLSAIPFANRHTKKKERVFIFALRKHNKEKRQKTEEQK